MPNAVRIPTGRRRFSSGEVGSQVSLGAIHAIYPVVIVISEPRITLMPARPLCASSHSMGSPVSLKCNRLASGAALSLVLAGRTLAANLPYPGDSDATRESAAVTAAEADVRVDIARTTGLGYEESASNRTAPTPVTRRPRARYPRTRSVQTRR